MADITYLSSSWLMAALLLSLRLSAVFLLTPLLAAANVPIRFRVIIILALSAVLCLGFPGAVIRHNSLKNAEHIVMAGIFELLLGLTLALAIMVAFAAYSVAGRLLDFQVGFGLSQVFDTGSSSQQTVLASIFNQFGILVFFTVDGHHALLRGLAYSLEHFPLGEPWQIAIAVGPVLKQVAGLFGLGVSLAAPVIFCVLMVELALCVVARSLPQMNMLTMGVPVKIVVGLLALSLWFLGAGSAMGKVYSTIYQTWNSIFEAARPKGAVSPAASSHSFEANDGRY